MPLNSYQAYNAWVDPTSSHFFSPRSKNTPHPEKGDLTREGDPRVTHNRTWLRLRAPGKTQVVVDPRRAGRSQLCPLRQTDLPESLGVQVPSVRQENLRLGPRARRQGPDALHGAGARLLQSCHPNPRSRTKASNPYTFPRLVSFLYTTRYGLTWTNSERSPRNLPIAHWPQPCSPWPARWTTRTRLPRNRCVPRPCWTSTPDFGC